MSSSSSSSPIQVGLVVTIAPLLSGELRDCADLVLGDVRCSTGGVAAVQALVQYHNGESPVLVVPIGDFKSPLTEMSRLAFGVNVMIYANELKWRTWTVPAYTVKPRRFEYSDVYDAQEPLMPAVVSNVITAPNERWHPYVKPIHFDEETHLALLYITKEYLETTSPQVESIQQLLHYIQKYNQANGCQTNDGSSDPESTVFASSHSIFKDVPFSQWWREEGPTVLEVMRESKNDATGNQTNSQLWKQDAPLPEQNFDPKNCFVPVVVFEDESKDQFDILIEAFNQTEYNTT
jgi:hypothetical protein